jgi:hypothetical protein
MEDGKIELNTTKIDTSEVPAENKAKKLARALSVPLFHLFVAARRAFCALFR